MTGFENKKLGDIASVISGYAFKSEEFGDAGIPVIKIANIRVGSVDLSDCAKVSPEYLPRINQKYQVNPGDILISLTGSHLTQPNSVVGRVAQMPFNAPQCLLNQKAGKVTNKDEEKCDSGYLYRYLSLVSQRGDIAVMASGAASQANVSPTQVESLTIKLPTLGIQQRITAILSPYDDLIENNLRRIKILEEMAQNLYREWFVKFRFPGHEQVRMVDSPVGEIPEGWGVVPLSVLVTTQYGYTESTQEKPVGPKFLRGMDINKRPFIDWSEVPYCPISDEVLSKFKLDFGDILVIRMADPGKVGIVEKDIHAVFASYLVRLRITDERILPYYLFYFLNSDRYQGYITGASTGTTRKSASAPVMTGIDIALPSRKSMDKFIRHYRKLIHRCPNLLKNHELNSVSDNVY